MVGTRGPVCEMYGMTEAYLGDTTSHTVRYLAPLPPLATDEIRRSMDDRAGRRRKTAALPDSRPFPRLVSGN